MIKRINSIDFHRGMITILMVVYHSYALFSHQNYGIIHDIWIGVFVLGWTPSFVQLAGTSQFLFIIKKSENNMSRKDIFKIVFKRGIFLICFTAVLQIIYGILFPHPKYFIIHWNIFYIMGLGMILFFMIPYLRPKIRIASYIIIIASLLILGCIINYYGIWTLDVLILYGDYTFIPWINFFVTGLIFGDFLVNCPKHLEKKGLIIFFIIGVILMAFWRLLAKDIQIIRIWQFVLANGMYFVTMPVYYYVFDIKHKKIFLYDRIIVWSYGIFSLYYLHLAIIKVSHLLILRLNPDFINMETYQYIIYILAVLIAMDLFAQIWKKYKFKYGLEYFMRRFSDFPFPSNFFKIKENQPNQV